MDVVMMTGLNYKSQKKVELEVVRDDQSGEAYVFSFDKVDAEMIYADGQISFTFSEKDMVLLKKGLEEAFRTSEESRRIIRNNLI